MSVSATSYTVRLDRFEGPMDLLLHLIRRAELDVTEIALAEVTEQYLATIESLRRVDVDEAGDFLVVAATLIEIKSRLVNPEVVDDGEERSTRRDETVDPAAELLRHLLAFKAYKDAADDLERRADAWSKRFPTARAGSDLAAVREAALQEDELDLDDVGLWELASAFRKIVDSVNFDRLGEHNVEFDDTPIEVHQSRLVERLAGLGGRPVLGLVQVFEGQTKSSAIGVFLAILELVRQQRVRVFRAAGSGEAVGTATVHTEISVELLEPPVSGEQDAGGGTDEESSEL